MRQILVVLSIGLLLIFGTAIEKSYSQHFPDLGTALTTPTGGVQATLVAALPTCNAAHKGAWTVVTDEATAAAYHGAVTDSGTIITPVYCNGTSWLQD